MPVHKTTREQLPATDHRQEFSSRPYPKPSLNRAEPDLSSIAAAFSTLFDECNRIYNGSASAADQEHADYIRAKLDQVRVMIRGRVHREQEEQQLRLFS